MQIIPCEMSVPISTKLISHIKGVAAVNLNYIFKFQNFITIATSLKQDINNLLIDISQVFFKIYLKNLLSHFVILQIKDFIDIYYKLTYTLYIKKWHFFGV